MLQTQAAEPPDETGAVASPRLASDRRLKSNGAAEQVMKCPRCDSMNTKFCYYNNYSLTQPRHFCKNCRRYWTKGGALRNVPVGGGCRKNKRNKQRSVDPSSLGSPDETASNMLASISSGHCSPLLPGFVVPSTASFVELANDSHRFGLTFARIQESIRLGEQSGAVPSNPDVYGLGAPTGLVNSSSSQSSPVGSLPAFEAGLLNLGYPSSSVKSEPGLLYPGSHFSALFETPSQMASAATATNPCPDEQLPGYSMPGGLFNGCGVEAQVGLQPQKLALHLAHEEQGKDRGQMHPAFEDEINANFRRMKGKSFLQCVGEGRALSDWQGVPESLFETAGESNLWSNTGWPEMHVFSGSAAGAML